VNAVEGAPVTKRSGSSRCRGCAFVSLWAACGVEVTIVARSLMPQEDPEVGTALLAAFEARGIHLVRGRVVGLARAAGRRGRSRWYARTTLRPR
jgi:pyruvate/2-oxoglutarate dehydrogenase complex dihydrolipoamide dehydrogenase (E3) component